VPAAGGRPLGEALGAHPYGTIFQPARSPATIAVCRMMASLATVVQLCLCASPTVIAVQLGFDADVGFWAGCVGRWALGVPIFILALHYVHMWQITAGRQSRVLFLAMAVPAIFLGCIGGWYMSCARRIQRELRSPDCTISGLPQKARLQHAHEDAKWLQEACFSQIREEGTGLLDVHHPTLATCEGRLLSDRPRDSARGGRKFERLTPDLMADIHYLAALEDSYLCGGFCRSSGTLWSAYDLAGQRGSACSEPLADKLAMAGYKARLVWGISLADLLIYAALIGATWRGLARLGYARGDRDGRSSAGDVLHYRHKF